MIQDESMLKSKNVELTININTMDIDRLKFMKNMKHNASQMGESGIRFLGLRVLDGNDVDQSNNLSELDVMRQVL